MFGELPYQRNENSVVDWNGDENGEANEALEYRRRELKVGSKSSDHCAALLDEVGVELSLDYIEH